MGKLPNRELTRLLACIKKDARTIVPPTPGYDSGVHLVSDDLCLVISTDPCINVPAKYFGWLLIHYAASDVALFGAKPKYCTVNLLGPASTKHALLFNIMKHACRASEELGVNIVTGHTGIYSGLTTVVGVCTTYGFVNRERLITPGNAKAGDSILCVKTVGLETVVNFCLANKVIARSLLGSRRADEIAKSVPLESCVREALLLANTKGVHAMHDATEGGLTTALNEMVEASNNGFEVDFRKFPFASGMQELGAFFRLSDEEMIATSSTGTFLAAVDPRAEETAISVLKENGVDAQVIGRFIQQQSRVLIKDGRKTSFPRKGCDPYERILSGKV